jgi:hypothetical protein
MSYPTLLTERVKFSTIVLTSNCIDGGGSKQTATIDMGKFRRLVAIGVVQNTAATTTVPHATVKILDSTALGTCSGTAIVSHTMMSQTAGVMRSAILEIRDEQVGKQTARSHTGRFVRVRIVWGTRPAQVGCLAIAGDSRFGALSNTVTTTS